MYRMLSQVNIAFGSEVFTTQVTLLLQTKTAIFTARLAKRAKVMFLQACVTHSVQRRGGGGGGGGHQHQWSTTYPPPPPPQDQVRMSTPPPPSPPPGTRSECLPTPLGPGQNVYPLPPWDQVRMSTPSPPGTRSECLPSPPPLHAGGRYASYWNAFL